MCGMEMKKRRKIEMIEKQVEEKLRIKSNNRCIMCHNEDPSVWILNENKEKTEDNLILLCTRCAHKYIGNLDILHQLKQKRDYWYEQVEEMSKKSKEIGNSISKEEIEANRLDRNGIAIYHVIYENEGFEESAKTIYELLSNAQEKMKDYHRLLYLDIDGHMDEKGMFDEEMRELQEEFVVGTLLPFFHEIHLPLLDIRNPDPQRNDIPKEFRFLSNEKEAMQFLLEEMKDGGYMIEKLKKEYYTCHRKLIYRKKNK